LINEILSDALESGAPIKVTKKSGATITGTVQSIKNGHFVLKCSLGSIAIFFNSISTGLIPRPLGRRMGG
jgi:hypothetical protein